MKTSTSRSCWERTIMNDHYGRNLIILWVVVLLLGFLKFGTK